MSKIITWCTFLALAGVLAACGPSAADRAVSGSWGRVIKVPGLAALNTGKGGGPEVSAVSCASPGNCAVGGDYWDPHSQQGFVAVERNGRWGKAIEVPGLAALNGGGGADVVAVSCAPSGGCAAGGYYVADVHSTSGFVVNEENGVWDKAVTIQADYYSSVDSISCTSAGNCLVGGWAEDDYDSPDWGFVAEERNGRWGQAIALPGLAVLNGAGGGADDVSALWCASPGNCAAGGTYYNRLTHNQGFVASERNGRWGKAIEVPGLAALNTKGYAAVTSVSCASAGNCLAGGYYHGSRGVRGFAVIEQDGTWGTAIPVPGLAALDTGHRPTTVTSVSCAPEGSCAASGFYADRSHRRQGFVAGEDNGTWGTPIPMPGLAALNTGGFAQVDSLSCPAPGTCVASGYYTDRSGYHQGFVTRAR